MSNPRCGVGGAEEARTPDLQLAKLPLCQLSYSPTRMIRPASVADSCTPERSAGIPGCRGPVSSTWCLKERGALLKTELCDKLKPADACASDRPRKRGYGFPRPWVLLRKEVIQPQVPLRLPCYDFTPVTDHSLGRCLPQGVSSRTSGPVDSRGVTGGVYKARERIHRGMLIRDY